MGKKEMLRVREELDRLAARSGGLLRGEAVVAFAKNPKTALHSRFEWDDAKASHEYRLWQARELIQTYVTVMASGSKPIRAFVSLRADRKQAGGGYRGIVSVFDDRDLREQLLAEALDEVNHWRDKYRRLQELAPIFAGIDRVAARSRKKKIA